MTSTNLIVDGDGHVLEDLAELQKFLPYPYAGYRPSLGFFPALDHMHSGNFVNGVDVEARISGPGKVGPDEWIDFLDNLGAEATVLYPTAGLSYGKICDLDWAKAATRAYNDWLHATYMARSPRLKGMALLPMQDPEAAAAELARAVEELGMCGAMLPSNGLKAHLGSKDYWPVYKEADRLGCVLAVHGGCHDRFGFDDMNIFAATHAIGHPVGIMASFVGMLFNGVYDRFPGMRAAFLEAGVAIFLALLERCDGSYKSFPVRGRSMFELGTGESVGDYIVRHVREGRIGFGCEGDEPALGYAIKVFGNGPFLYSSDFPHEVTLESCKEEIEELLEREELGRHDKEAVLGGNARRFYRLNGAPAAARR